jgi:glycosyltransferase involved in cell wall biosynthesis
MKILVIVPVYNEWPHLMKVLDELKTYATNILVVDDGSYDKTYLSQLKKDGYQFLNLPFNLGHWGAVQAGFRYSLSKDYEGAVTFDGDGQHIPGEIPKLLAYLDQGYDLVIGANERRGDFFRKTCWRVFKGLSGLNVNDITSGFRAYSRQAMARLISPSFPSLEFQDLGVLFMANEMGLKAIETPVRMSARLDEKSRVFPGLSSIIRYFLITLTFILVRKP